MSTQPHARRFTQTALACLLIALAALLTPIAQAQTAAPFAPPLASADLARWIKALELEGGAARAAEAAFERALAESQALRDGDMSAFERAVVAPTDPQVTLEALEQRSRRAKALVSQQAAIENRLFNELAALSQDDQRRIVEAERRAAARRRHVAAIDRFQRNGITPDLVTIMQRTEGLLAAAEAAGASAVLLDYDQRVTDLMQRATTLAMESGPAVRRAHDASEAERAAQPADAGSEQSARDRIRANMQARSAALAPMFAIRSDIASLNRATVERLLPILPVDQARELRLAFIKAHYPAVAIKRETPERLLRQVKSIAETDASVAPEMVVTAEQIIAAWRERSESIERRMMDAIDARREQRGGDLPMFISAEDGGADGPQMFDDGLAELRRDRDEATTRTRNELAALHTAFASLARDEGPERPITFSGLAAADGAEIRASAVMIVTGDGGSEDAIAFDLSPEMMRLGDAGLRVIDARGFDAMMSRLGWSDAADLARARAAFDAYREGADARLRALIGSTPGNGAMEIEGGGMLIVSQGEPPEAATIEQAASQLASDDEQFFAALGDPSDPGLARERAIRSRERLRQRVGGGSTPMFQPWGRFERVDLVSIVASAPLPKDRREHAEAIAAAHGERMNGLLANLLAAQETMRRLEASFMRTTDHGDGRVERSIEVPASDGDAFPRAIQAMSDSANAVTNDVRRTLDELRTQLPFEVARHIRRAAYAQAMPQIVTDRRSAEPRLEEAIMLPTLSDESRRSLIELLAAHQDSVDALVDRFVVDAERASQEGGPAQGPGPQELRGVRQSGVLQGRLRFDRSELNDATMRRLRALLNSEENGQIADLPPAPRSRDGEFSFSF